MADEKRTIILNGSKMWFTCILFLIAHGGAGIWWASSINTRVAQLEKQQVKIEKNIETTNTKIGDLIEELAAQKYLSRSA